VKLLFDQNLSHKLARRLTDIFPDSTHVREVGLKEANDPLVWDYAKQQSFMIISKDADFHQRSFVFGFPPKVVWVQLGNCTTDEVEQAIRKYFTAIKDFYEDAEAAFLVLS
jgi:predicted nuclease of predicted toxin-antitoxin system